MDIEYLKQSGYHDRQVMRSNIMGRVVNGDKAALRDMNLLNEFERAVELAEQYKTNSDRIKRLLSLDPVTILHGQVIMSRSSDSILFGVDILFNGRSWVNPILL